MSMLIGTTEQGTPVTIDSSDLTTHGVILGRTGSGKTGATIATIEEAVMSGASVIVLDPKGDLTNLALAFPNLSANEFAPWTEDDKDPTEIAARALKELGHLAPNVKRWKDSADVTIYAPGKTRGGGKEVNVLSSFDKPTGNYTKQGLRDLASSLVSSILSAIGHNSDPMTDPANVFLTDATINAWESGSPAGLETWAALLSNPPNRLKEIDGLKLNDFFSKNNRMKIARSIIGFRRQASKWLEGSPLSIESYIGIDKPKVSVFTMRHLEESERQFFSSMLLTSIVDYMFQAPASSKLKLLVVLDEARGYLPPYPLNPPTKKPICTLLAQGRAQGIGMLIGTQNPNDMDYKALTNVGTWFLGNLRPRDCARDLKIELSNRDVDTDTLSKIPQRHFLILKRNGDHIITKIRWAYSYLRGPMNGEDLLQLNKTSGVLKAKNLIGSKDLDISYVVSNHHSISSTVKVEYSTDNGNKWCQCSLKKYYKRYATAPEGRQHRVSWDTIKNFGYVKSNGLLRLVINEEPTKEYSKFSVDNSKVSRSLMANIFG
jgi:hypothetical protein